MHPYAHLSSISTRVGLSCLFAMFIACGGGSSAEDGGLDAAPDTATPDTSTDSATDAATDAGDDAATDAGDDAATDAGDDAATPDADAGPVLSYSVGGTLTGLSGTLVLQNNGADDLSLTMDGPFSFSTPVPDGGGYHVTIRTQPSTQTCTVATGRGRIAGANITNVSVSCVDDAPGVFSIGGNVSGLMGSLVLQNNGGDDLTLVADGSFRFATTIADGGAYEVSVRRQPAGGRCTLMNASGVVAGAIVTDVQVDCLSVATDSIGVAAGAYHSLALMGDGTVWAWGRNTKGQLGHAVGFTSSTPVSVCADAACTSPLSGITAVAARGDHSLALSGAGEVWAWGDNAQGQLGDGTTTDAAAPTGVCADSTCAASLSGVTAIAAGSGHTLALKGDGTIWAWGDNSNGELGDGSNVARHTPVQVCATGEVAPCGAMLSNVTAIAAGDHFSLALLDDGTVRAWGANWDGRLGDLSRVNRSAPVQVCAPGETAPCTTFLAGVQQIAAGGSGHSLALLSDGSVWSWGAGGFGQLGSASSMDASLPTQVCDDGVCAGHLMNIAAVAAGYYHSLALDMSGTVWGWGRNNYGQVGDGTMTDWNGPKAVPGLTSVQALAGGSTHTVALRSDGTIWSWGRNNSGQLGDGSSTDRWSPVSLVAGP